ncbi:MAG: DinB family protein [Gemmatimonadetes bacterium]|nr:DinB family protein [Gemmatimonadota bacterium]
MNHYAAPELANAFRTVRRNTVQAAEEIPEGKYDFVAAPGGRSVRGLLTHIAFLTMIPEDMHKTNRLTTLSGYDFGAIVGRVDAEERTSRTKAQIIELLRSEGERFASWLESLTPDELGERIADFGTAPARMRLEHLMGVKEHEMHHRGQLMLVQRMLGMVPHLTRQREERFRARAAAATASAAT